MKGEIGFSVLIGRPVQGLAVVEVAGDLDSLTTPAFRASVAKVMDDGAAHLIVDFSRLAFIDSAGLADLADAARRAAIQAVHLVLVRPPGDVARVLAVTVVVRDLAMYQTCQEALDAA